MSEELTGGTRRSKGDAGSGLLPLGEEVSGAALLLQHHDALSLVVPVLPCRLASLVV
jgi:hypothetical protein